MIEMEETSKVRQHFQDTLFMKVKPQFGSGYPKLQGRLVAPNCSELSTSTYLSAQLLKKNFSYNRSGEANEQGQLTCWSDGKILKDCNHSRHSYITLLIPIKNSIGW